MKPKTQTETQKPPKEPQPQPPYHPAPEIGKRVGSLDKPRDKGIRNEYK